MEWLFGEEVQDKTIIDRIESLIQYSFPEEYKQVVLKNDTACPEFVVFNTAKKEGRVFNSLISIEDGTLDGALDAVIAGKQNQWSYEGLPWRYIPFGDDPFGNSICFDRETDHVVFFNHETQEVEEVANSFTQFIDSLYDDGFVPFDEE